MPDGSTNNKLPLVPIMLYVTIIRLRWVNENLSQQSLPGIFWKRYPLLPTWSNFIIPARISNHMSSKVQDMIIYPFPSFNGYTVKFENGYFVKSLMCSSKLWPYSLPTATVAFDAFHLQHLPVCIYIWNSIPCTTTSKYWHECIPHVLLCNVMFL